MLNEDRNLSVWGENLYISSTITQLLFHVLL